jgi:DNA repair protein RecO (recombination protein O)
MPVIRDEAVVLGRLDYSENSQILVLFTREHGKARSIAKGIRRGTKTRFAAGIDLLDVGTVVLSAKQERGEALATLTEWKQTEALSGLRGRLPRLHAALYAAELTSRLTEDWDPHPRLFDYLLKTLRDLAAAGGADARSGQRSRGQALTPTLSQGEREKSEVLTPTVRFQISLLRDIGAQPRFDACVLCGKGVALTHFSSFEGGLVCRHCEPVQVEKREVGPNTLALLRGQRKDLPQSEGLLAAAFSLLNYHISHLMSREPAMANYVVPQRLQRRVE